MPEVVCEISSENFEREARSLAGGKRRTLVDQRERKLAAEAERAEIELRELKGELIPLPWIEKTWADIIVTTRSRLMAVPARVTPRIVGEQDRSRIQQSIDGEIREALIEISRSVRGIPERQKLAPVTTPAS